MAYLMPDFHNPTGATMDAQLRERVLALARAQGAVVVVDETMAELDIDRASAPLPMAAYGPAVLIGSAGKCLWGGLRIGWIRAERQLIQKLARHRSAGDLGTPMLEQLLVKNLLDDFDSVLDQRRGLLRAGRNQVERALADAIPEWTVPHVDGGLATWVQLGAPVSSQLRPGLLRRGRLSSRTVNIYSERSMGSSQAALRYFPDGRNVACCLPLPPVPRSSPCIFSPCSACATGH
ncbi:hypothetical protein BH09ACT3_BH09ACT3_12380 [soil metagenome]